MSRPCPDCEVSLERVEHNTGPDIPSQSLSIEDPDGGLLSRIPYMGDKYLDAYLCPECGLVRFYAYVE